jgi:hypothetical protein
VGRKSKVYIIHALVNCIHGLRRPPDSKIAQAKSPVPAVVAE